MNTTEFLNSVYGDDDRNSLFSIYQFIDDLLNDCEDKNDFSTCDELLIQVDLNRCTISTALGFVTAFFPARDKIGAYPFYYSRLKNHLTLLDPFRVDSLMRGLDP